MTEPDVVFALRPLVAWFVRRGVEYRIGGSLASSVHGVARSTLGVDLFVDLPARLPTEMVADLEGLYYVDAE